MNPVASTMAVTSSSVTVWSPGRVMSILARLEPGLLFCKALTLPIVVEIAPDRTYSA